MQRFWVVGGAEDGTRFRNVPRKDEEWFGPFESYQEAEREWSRHARRPPEASRAAYRIERFDPEEAPRCSD